MGSKVTGSRIVVWALAIMGGWWLLQTLAGSSTFWRFLADGMVPGTNISLSPDTILWSIPALFGLSIVLVFRAELLRLAGRIERPMPRSKRAVAAVAPAKPARSAGSDLSQVLHQMIVAVSERPARPVRHKVKKAPKPQPVVVIKLPRQSRLINAFRHVQIGLRAYRAERYRPVQPVIPSGPSLIERSTLLGAAGVSVAARGLSYAASGSAVATQRAGSLVSRAVAAVVRPVFGTAARQRYARLAAGILLLLLAAVGLAVRSVVTLAQGLLALVSLVVTSFLAGCLAVIQLVTSLVRAVWVGVSIGVEYLQIFIILFVRMLIAIVILAAIYGLRAWRWAVPYMDQVDDWVIAWVRARFGRHEPAQILLTMLREAFHSIAVLYRRVRTYLRAQSHA
jgi:hypothetical protein